MTDELKLNKDLENAARAQALLDDETLNDAFSKMEDAYQQAWMATHVNDVAGRERLWQAIHIVHKVKDHLNSVVTNGKLAQRELDDLAGKEKRRLFGIV